MDTLSRSTSIALEAQAPGLRSQPEETRRKVGGGLRWLYRSPQPMRFRCHLQKQQNPARTSLAGFSDTRSEKRFLVVRRIAVVRACRRNSCYCRCRCRHSAYRSTSRAACATRCSGARGCTPRLRHRVAGEHRKENYPYKLFHETSPKDHEMNSMGEAH